MRAAYHLAIAVFSLGTVVAPNGAGTLGPATQRPVLLDTDRTNAADFLERAGPRQGATLASHFSRGALIGETLPEDVELHPISRHETYRYAIVNSHRVIVDAASRQIIYVVQ